MNETTQSQENEISGLLEQLSILSKSRKPNAKVLRTELIGTIANAIYNHFKSRGFIAVGKESINALFLSNTEKSQSQNYRIMQTIISYLIQNGKFKPQEYFKTHTKLINKPLYCFDSGVIGHKTLKFKPSFNDFLENDLSGEDISVSIPTYNKGSVTPSTKSVIISKFKTSCLNYVLQ